MPIFRSDLNKLVELLRSEDFITRGFTFNPDLSNTGLIVDLPFRITHQDSGFYFEISSVGRGFRMPCLPGSIPSAVTLTSSNWAGVLTSCRAWIRRVTKELEQPDPWALLNQGKIITDELPIAERGLEEFNAAELVKVQEFVLSVKEFLLSKAQPSEVQLRAIDEKLTYLIDSARRQSKQDWAHTAIGVIFTIAIGLAMAPDQANRLFELTSAFIRTLFLKLLT